MSSTSSESVEVRYNASTIQIWWKVKVWIGPVILKGILTPKFDEIPLARIVQSNHSQLLRLVVLIENQYNCVARIHTSASLKGAEPHFTKRKPAPCVMGSSPRAISWKNLRSDQFSLKKAEIILVLFFHLGFHCSIESLDRTRFK
jgi:hypothetical protein